MTERSQRSNNKNNKVDFVMLKGVKDYIRNNKSIKHSKNNIVFSKEDGLNSKSNSKIKSKNNKSKEKNCNGSRISSKILNIFNLNTYKRNIIINKNIVHNSSKTPLNKSKVSKQKKINGHTSSSTGTYTATASYNKTPTLVDKETIKLNKKKKQCEFLVMKEGNNIEEIFISCFKRKCKCYY